MHYNATSAPTSVGHVECGLVDHDGVQTVLLRVLQHETVGEEVGRLNYILLYGFIIINIAYLLSIRDIDKIRINVTI